MIECTSLFVSRWFSEIEKPPADNAVPVDGLDRLLGYEREIAAGDARLVEGDRRDRERERHVSSLPVVDAFAQRENDVRQAISNIGYYQEAVQDVPKRGAEAAEIESGVVRDLAAIGPGWTTQHVAAFSDAAGTIARIQASADSRAEAVRTASQAGSDLERVEGEAQQATESLRLAQARLEAVPAPPVEPLEELERKRDRLDTLAQFSRSLNSPR